jgi:hypothetical protein
MAYEAEIEKTKKELEKNKLRAKELIKHIKAYQSASASLSKAGLDKPIEKPAKSEKQFNI